MYLVKYTDRPDISGLQQRRRSPNQLESSNMVNHHRHTIAERQRRFVVPSPENTEYRSVTWELRPVLLSHLGCKDMAYARTADR